VKIRFVLAIASIAVFGLAASAQAQDKALIEKGMKVYGDQKCSMCHSIAGKGNAKGPLDGVGSKLTADEIRLWMTDPKTMTAKAKATRTPLMKAYPSLPKADMDALVAYMLSLKKK
jgi:mono/diheme cytochrome c family protein